MWVALEAILFMTLLIVSSRRALGGAVSCLEHRSPPFLVSVGLCRPEAKLVVQAIESGHLNAIAFWFDLHLDEEISITSAPAYIGLAGQMLEVGGAGGSFAAVSDGTKDANPVRVRGKSMLQNLGRPQEAPMHPPCKYTAANGSEGHFTPARVITTPSKCRAMSTPTLNTMQATPGGSAKTHLP
jgi:hypothetical protein